jgi:hypothetical protein
MTADDDGRTGSYARERDYCTDILGASI